MPKCKLCDTELDDSDSAMEHIRENHTAEIDEELNEYISDAEKTVYDNLIEE